MQSVIITITVFDLKKKRGGEQASTLTFFLACPFGQLPKKSTCPTQSFSCQKKKIMKIIKTRE
jgi:hypothetical protein